ncbi:MAG TPA: YeeE/YedE thiosulfate transporter family protein [Bacteroidales bacterium]|nr:YeeE/YedE thiosulfate transporter family protein [Bacteroidales bacterium]
MGPLVPFIISEEFNLVVALIAGIGFGFILEQAGFSSTKKLVGLFYGYDFTVLKVFFTAGVTAMIGVLLFGHIGILDLSVIYINPTFLTSAIVGGVIMGAGFIIGGFCPGTSIVAASVGKLDGLAFVFGGFLGVLAFSVGFPYLEELYYANAQGPVIISDKLGISKMLFAFALTAVAFAAFYFTGKIEDRVNNVKQPIPKQTFNRYAISMGLAFVLLGMMAITPDYEQLLQSRIARAEQQKKCVFYEVSAEKLAFEIANNHYKVNVIDVRSPEEFEEYHIPLAINIPLEEILDRKWERYFKQTIKPNYFYAESDTIVKKACLLARFVGDSENYILRESVSQFEAMFQNPQPPPAYASKQEFNTYNFRKEVAYKMENLVEALKNINQPIVQEPIKIQGGCS